MTTHEALFDRYLTLLECEAGIEVNGTLPLPERFYKLSRAVERGDLSHDVPWQLSQYLTTKVHSRIKELDGNIGGVPLAHEVSELLLSSLIRGVAQAHMSKVNDPKVHHWLSAGYLKGFSVEVENAKKVRASIPVVVPSSIGLVDALVTDLAFAHEATEDRGYYDLEAEYAFAAIEGRFGEATRGKNPTEDRGALWGTALAVTQYVRSPLASGEFAPGDLKTVVKRVLEGLEGLGAGYIVSVRAEVKLPLTGDVPPRVYRTASGVEVTYYPVSSHWGLLLCTEALPWEEGRDILMKMRANLLAAARRRGVAVFGLTTKDL